MTGTPPVLCGNDRKMALEANLPPFIAEMQTLLRSFGPKAAKSDLAKILIIECIERGYVTEGWIDRIARHLPLKAWDVVCILEKESGPNCLWQCDDDERYSLPSTA